MAAKRTKRKRVRGARDSKGRFIARGRKSGTRKGPKKRKAARPPPKPKKPIGGKRFEYQEPPSDYDDEDVAEYAELWGVSEEEAEAVLEESVDMFANVPLDNSGRPEIDYMTDLADTFDVEVSDMYDMYYGYAPGYSRS